MTKEVILVVEDNDMLREGLREMLAVEGFTALGARNGVEALDVMSTVLPNLIVSDVTMPVMDGHAFYNAVRTHNEWVTIPFIFLTAHAEPSEVRAGRSLGADDYLVKPINRDELVSIIQTRLMRSRQVQVGQLQHAYRASLTALANAIELRDPSSTGHIERIVGYTHILAELSGWNQRQIENLRFGAILHDIGKIHISESILLKKSSLTEEEWAEVKLHPVTGSEMIKGIPLLAEAVPVVRSHHENWDGSGYPDGLAGSAIPEGARIVALADAFDAMTSARLYRLLHTPQEARQEILLLAGKYYDPNVVEAFESAWEARRIQSMVQRS
jgi:putative two-component system response regulator